MRGSATLLLTVLAGACGAAPAAETPAAAAALAGRASSERLPDRFMIGRGATAEEISRLDIDVMPDGTGLPPGAGNAVEGTAVYATKCVACHGVDGELATVANPLVGRRPGDAFDFADRWENESAKTIGSYWPHAPTLFDYVRRAMPFDRPGSLTDEEVYGVVAWLLWKNDIIERTDVMDAQTLPGVRMPARERFVRDDRETSTRVR
jgi:S-disulfanyl-L-cysteine oxidoreductase SoxD